MHLKTLVLAIWAAIHPAAPKLPDAPEIATAIETVISQDPRPPVFGSREEDAAVMAYYAFRESSLRRNAVGDGGRSFGVWQENATTGRADILTQARAWLYMLHEGERICPDNPAAPLSGGCRAAAHMALRRVAKARELLEFAKRALEPPLPPLPSETPTQDAPPAEPEPPRHTKSAVLSPFPVGGAFASGRTFAGMLGASATRRAPIPRRVARPAIVSRPMRASSAGWLAVCA